MQPYICYICGKSNPDDTDAEWVKFKDFTEVDSSFLGDDEGKEYFCGEHIDHAKELSHLTMDEALKIINEAYPKEAPKKRLFEKIFS
jgi:hypothetical protein